MKTSPLAAPFWKKRNRKVLSAASNRSHQLWHIAGSFCNVHLEQHEFDFKLVEVLKTLFSLQDGLQGRLLQTLMQVNRSISLDSPYRQNSHPCLQGFVFWNIRGFDFLFLRS